ncbi:60S ribosome subunit biogenesis protein NIP7-like [Symbiodinium microadriaticum]|uniref:60S ribosome subunit biogenesis protein NIP7-like n=1 Tax=Symbiodinium microadriaticum TaxID=2951 RepID=A0A1Q9DAS8_SYMMI|nr:60S ribosome subunit biogenesis protein NIP7-like [Symbiodinium microadriaticum]
MVRCVAKLGFISFGDYTEIGRYPTLFMCQSATIHGSHQFHADSAHLRRITEGAPRNAGVVVLNEADVPIGFGVTARSTEECTNLGAEALVVYHQADVGEYLREEADLV